MSKIGIKQLTTFTDVDNANGTECRTIISPQGNFMLRYSPRNLTLFNLTSYNPIPIIIKTIVLVAVFSIDEQYLYFTNYIGISKYAITNQTIENIIQQSAYNKITDIRITKDYNILYFINNTLLKSYSLITSQMLVSATSENSTNNSCMAARMNFNEQKNVIITSSLNIVNNVYQSLCRICKWKIINGSFSIVQQANISYCIINEIIFIPLNSKKSNVIDGIVLTKKILNFKRNNTILLNIGNLTEIVRTSQSNKDSNTGYLITYHNYYLQYFYLGNSIWVYTDNLTTKPAVITVNNTKSLQYNKLKDQLYIIYNDQISKDVIKKYSVTFDCNKVTGALIDNSSKFQQNCKCQADYLFNKKTFACQLTKCGTSSTNSCICNYGYTFNYFNLLCDLDCSQIDRSLPVSPFRTLGNVQKCYCSPPYSWNSNNGDCSFIDCSQIKFSNSKSFDYFCPCQDQYFWNQYTSSCNSINTNANQTTNIVPISVDSPGSQPGLIIGLVLLVLLLIGALICFYVRKCRNNQESNSKDQDDQKQEKKSQIDSSPTERPVITRPPQKQMYGVQSNDNLAVFEGQTKIDDQKYKKQQQHHEDDIQNFSIGDEQQQQKVSRFSQLASNLQNPLH